MLDNIKNSISCPQGGLAALRVHLAAAAEARRRGDHGAASTHEQDAVIAMRAALAAGRQEVRA